MATLEVHDGQGRVQFIELLRDHPVLFGTSAACDVALQGEGIRPVHGRIRWKSKRFKIEASPDAEYVVINGHKMTTSSLEQGDEIAVGDCRMFLIRTEEDLLPSKQSKPAAEDERTHMRAAPVVPVREHGRRKSRSREVDPPLLERTDWLDSLRSTRPEPGIASTEAPLQRSFSRGRQDEHEIPLQRSSSRGRQDERAVEESEPKPKKSDGPGPIARLRALLGSVAPGREKIATSPLVIGLVASLAILVGMGFWLKSIIASTIASRTFDRGVQNLDEGDYRTAMRDFDSFVSANPQDPRAGRAQVLRALANVRQYVTTEGGTWSSALEAAQEMFEQVGRLPEFRDEQVNLAELIIKIGEGLADRARQGADPKSLKEAESVVGLHARVAGAPAPDFLNRSRLPSKLTDARAAVKKAQIRSQALLTMDQAIKDGAPSKVYDARDALVEQYADLAHDKDLVARMTAANELIRKAVSVDSTRRPAERASRPDPLGPTTSLVLRSGQDTVESPPSEEIVYALADGYAYALQGATGSPLWQAPLGLAAPFAPQAVPGDATAVAFDARFNELVRFDARTGALRWRLTLGEPAGDPPLVLGNQLAQVLPSGKLLLIGLESGELESTVNLGRPLARSPASDESGQHLYMLGRQDCLFVMAREPLSCIAVVYLGHQDASIPCTPARLGRFLVVPENDSLYNSRLHVLVLDQDGAKVRPVQDVDVSGWTWQSPSSAGPIVWGLGDKGGYEAFSVGDYASKTPFKSLARLTPDAGSSGPAFALATSDRELWVASGHSGRFDLDLERGAIEPKGPILQPGPALAPIQKSGKLVIMTFQDQANGGVALWAFDPDSNAVVWKTVVGAPWVAAPASTGEALSLVARDGREVLLNRAQVERGGFVVEGMPRPGAFSLPSGQRLRIEMAGKTIDAIVPGNGSKFLWVQDPARPGAWQQIDLPVALAANPLGWASGVLVPGRDARAYLIDPVTARSIAEPFVPKFDRDHQGTWLSPALVDQDTVVLADDVGRVHRVSLKTTPVPRLIGEAQQTLPQRIIAGPVSTGGAVVVVTADRHVRALSTRDLSPAGSWALEAPLSGEPAGVGDGCFIMDRAGGITVLDRDGHRTWSIKLKAGTVASPLVQEKTVWFLTRDGSLHVRGRSDGAALDRISLGILPAGGLLQVGKEVLVAVGKGAVRPVSAALRSAGGP